MIVTPHRFTLSLILSAIIIAASAIAWAQVSDEVLLVDDPVHHDLYAARDEVIVRSTVNGDLVAAGREVTVDGNVTGDILAAAQIVEVRSRVDDDLRAAGQQVRVTAPVAGHIVAAGQTVTINQAVGDWAWLAGDTVEVFGDIGGDLRIRARKITIQSNIEGNVQLSGDDLYVGEDANISGDLTWRGENKADISPDANIEGDFIEEPSPGIGDVVRTGGGLSFTLSVIVAATALFLLFRGPLRATANRIASRPVASLVLGFAISVGMPVLALFLIFTPLDAWVGLALLGMYVVILFLSVLTGLYAISDLLLRKLRPSPNVWQALAAIIVIVVAVGLLSFVPYIGAAVVIAIWLLGVGALCWGAWVALRNYGVDALDQSSSNRG